MSKISASLVLYNTPREQIETVTKCILDSNVVDLLFVIDNNPTKEIEEYFSKLDNVEYIKHDNTGYGSSHNIALRKAVELENDYHIILNPDIEFSSDVLKELINYMDLNADVVYVLPKVIYPNGELQYLCKLLPKPTDLIVRRFLPRNEFSKKYDDIYTLKSSGYNKIMNPPCLSGCFMFLRLNLIEKYKLFFDERYFMYLEDFDLIRRLHRVGKTIYYPFVTIVHNHSKESYRSKKMLKIHIQSAIKYFNKFGWFFDKERKQMNDAILKEINNAK